MPAYMALGIIAHLLISDLMALGREVPNQTPTRTSTSIIVKAGRRDSNFQNLLISELVRNLK